VRGPLNIERPVQGYPVIAQAGPVRTPGRKLAARTADVVYTVQYRIEDSRAYYNSLKGRMAKYGRSQDEFACAARAQTSSWGGTDKEAQEKTRLPAGVDPFPDRHESAAQT